MIERTGEAFEFDEWLTVVGAKLQPGDTAPASALDRLDPAAAKMETVRLADSAGTVRVLNVVNPLDTRVCRTETLRLERLRASCRRTRGRTRSAWTRRSPRRGG